MSQGANFTFTIRANVLTPIALALALMSAISVIGPPVAASTPLNVVVITLDTTRADALGVYGQKRPVSPRIDAMAAGGTLFEQVVTSSPSTLVSHSSLFTAKQPYAHGVRSNAGYNLSDANLTLAEVLRAAGYRTAAVVAAPVLGAGTNLDQGFDEYDDPASSKSVVDHVSELDKVHRDLRSAEDITNRGLAFLKTSARKPFFLWLHYFDPHQPLSAPQAFRTKISDSPYHAEVARVDHEVGRVLDQLEKSKLKQRTIVVLTADHGESLGEHSEDSHSFFVYDTTMRVPLIFWGASVVPRGLRLSNLVRLVDVAPTLVDLLGQPAMVGTQGMSLAPLLRDPASAFSVTGYGESIEPTVTFGSSVLRFVRSNSWKYIHKLEPELYDLESDPGETVNLASSRPEVLETLRTRLHELMSEAPAGPEDAAVDMNEETVAQLRALGYMGGSAPDESSADLDSLELIGPDPASRARDVHELAIAFGHMKGNEPDKAEPIFRRVVDRNPSSAFPFSGLVRSVEKQGRVPESISLLRRGIELDPKRANDYRFRLAKLLNDQGKADEAESLLREVLEGNACAVNVRLHLSHLLHENNDCAAEIQLLREAGEDCPNAIRTRNALAYALATTPDDDLRDGALAVEIAEKVVRESQRQHPGHLDTLACAYAETGRFDEAANELKRAIGLFKGRRIPKQVRNNFDRHLALVKANEPIREP